MFAAAEAAGVGFQKRGLRATAAGGGVSTASMPMMFPCNHTNGLRFRYQWTRGSRGKEIGASRPGRWDAAGGNLKF